MLMLPQFVQTWRRDPNGCAAAHRIEALQLLTFVNSGTLVIGLHWLSPPAPGAALRQGIHTTCAIFPDPRPVAGIFFGTPPEEHTRLLDLCKVRITPHSRNVLYGLHTSLDAGLLAIPWQ